MNKTFATALFFVALGVSAQSQARILGFSVIRSGGGSMEVAVTQDKTGDLNFTVKGCPAAQVELSVADQNAAKAILAEKAVIASQVILSAAPTGTWSSLRVIHDEPDFNGGFTPAKKTDVSSPIVLINSKVSAVLGNIEDAARTAKQTACP